MKLAQNYDKIKRYPYPRVHYQRPKYRPRFNDDVGHEKSEGDGAEAFEDGMTEVEECRGHDLKEGYGHYLGIQLPFLPG